MSYAGCSLITLACVYCLHCRHISSKDNPADWDNRGLHPLEIIEMESCWWNDLQWLQKCSMQRTHHNLIQIMITLSQLLQKFTQFCLRTNSIMTKVLIKRFPPFLRIFRKFVIKSKWILPNLNMKLFSFNLTNIWILEVEHWLVFYTLRGTESRRSTEAFTIIITHEKINCCTRTASSRKIFSDESSSSTFTYS